MCREGGAGDQQAGGIDASIMSATMSWVAWNSISGLPNWVPLCDVIQARVERGLADAETHRGVAESLDRERSEEIPKTPRPHEEVGRGYPRVLKDEIAGWDAAEAKELLLLAEAQSRRVRGDDERTDAAGARRVALRQT